MNKWTIHLSKTGDMDYTYVELNGKRFDTTGFTLQADVNSMTPILTLNFLISKGINEIELVTNNTEYKDQIIKATSKEKINE